jgi:bifunctional non-homologous end joining protein LigD
MHKTTLFLKDDRSDKEYSCWIEDLGGSYEVVAAWGPRGAASNTAKKTTAPVGLDAAMKVMDSILSEKTKKGYRPGEASETLIVPRAIDATFVQPMLLNFIDDQAAESYLKNDGWIAQPKHDGIRIQIHHEAGKVTAFARSGNPRALPAHVVDAVKKVGRHHGRLVIDGELVDDTVYVFDVVMCAHADVRSRTYVERLELLWKMIPVEGRLMSSPTALSTVEKLAMLKTLREGGAEGMCFKRASAKYSAGRPASGGDALKYKFVATATVKVTGVNVKRSVNMAMADGTDVGRVTIPPNKAVPAVGSLIEVRYLYARRGGCLIQPVYIRQRDDMRAADALKSLQFKAEERKAS